MTKRECKQVAYSVAGELLRHFLTVDGHCPVTKSGCWTDLPEPEFIRLKTAFEEGIDTLKKKGRRP
jgi:hypothetical protein